MNVRLYVEGAARRSDLDRSICRQAFSDFFAAAGIERRPRTIPCGGRDSAFNDFKTALKLAGANDVVLLLVDSEDAISPAHTVWQHLNDRDHWEKPDNATDAQAYLMVRVMETWFLADVETLRQDFGKEFKDAKIPNWQNLEEVEKEKIYAALSACTGKQYAKGNRSFELLAKVNPTVVEQRCPRAKILLDRLRAF